MPRTKSAERAARASERKRIRNLSVRSHVKREISGAKATIEDTPESAADAVKAATQSLDRAVSKGVLHPNNAARRKSRLMKKLNAAAGEAKPATAPAKKAKSAKSKSAS